LSKVQYSRSNLKTDYVPARNQIEEIVAKTWEKALGIEKIGIYDNFFDLGGSSLISIQIISQLQKELNIHIPVVSIYEKPTISSLAELLSSNEQDFIQKEDFRTQPRYSSIKRRKQVRQNYRKASLK